MGLSINSVLESIKRGLITTAEKPIEIRDDTILDKLLVNDDSDKSDANISEDELRKKLLWPPYYHFENKWWSYFWFVKDEDNLKKYFVKEAANATDAAKQALNKAQEAHKRIHEYSGDLIIEKVVGKEKEIDKVEEEILKEVEAQVNLFSDRIKEVSDELKKITTKNNSKPEEINDAPKNAKAAAEEARIFANEIKETADKASVVSIEVREIAEKAITAAENNKEAVRSAKELSDKVKELSDNAKNVAEKAIKAANNANEAVEAKKLANRYPIPHAIYRVLNRALRFFLWNIYVILGLISCSFREKLNNTNNQVAKCDDNGKNWFEKVGYIVETKGFDLSRSNKLNAFVLFGVAVLCIYLMISSLLFFVRDVVFFQSEISTTPTGVMKMTQPCGVEHYVFVHSSAKLWNDTGVDVVKGDKVKISYSGAFYSSIRDLSESAINRRPTKYKMTNLKHKGDTGSIVKYCTYKGKDAAIGSFLYGIAPSTNDMPDEININQVDTTGDTLIVVNESGTLRIAVNDISLPDNKTVFTILKDSLVDMNLKRELLNHALYPRDVDSQYDILYFDSICTQRQETFLRYFIIHDLKDNTIKNVFLKVKNLKSINDSIYKLLIKLRNPSNIDEVRKVLRVKIKEQELLKEPILDIILNYVNSKEQIIWGGEEQKNLWYNDNVGDLLVNVTVTRGGYSPLSKEYLFRTLDETLEWLRDKLDDIQWLKYVFIVFSPILIILSLVILPIIVLLDIIVATLSFYKIKVLFIILPFLIIPIINYLICAFLIRRKTLNDG